LTVLAAAYVDPRVLSPLVAIVLIIAAVSWTGVARLVRAEMLRLRASEFVLAARSLGFSEARILFAHALPNALSPALVAATFAVGGGILTESVVSYLGFGVRHPLPSWGALINESRSAQHWWIQLWPGLFIFAAVASFNLLGEALRDALDPRSEGRAP
jgi:peptide/nickel transport system permease protein